MISGVLIFMFFIQFLSITFDSAATAPTSNGESRMDAPPAEIRGRLIEFMFLSVAVGTAGSLLIGRVISAPISNLAKAAHQIGAGKLDVRVPAKGSQEMIELAETFNKMASDLQYAEELRNNLMADVSHELRTPLTVLESNLRAVLDHVYTLDESEVANLYSQTRHLIRLVNDLRELSLAESGQLHLEKIPVNIQTLISESLQAIEPLSAEKNIQMENEPIQLSEINVDPFRIRQALFNLLSNALRHTPHGGKISIATIIHKKEIIISIQDTGDGLTPDELASVFNRFYRTDRSRTRETGGTGLGLSIVKALITAHGGTVNAQSNGKGLGSTFSFSIPL
jgi:two-component system OmpR family sensor kinase/two-component system sensor histidine kinase BaeS